MLYVYWRLVCVWVTTKRNKGRRKRAKPERPWIPLYWWICPWVASLHRGPFTPSFSNPRGKEEQSSPLFTRVVYHSPGPKTVTRGAPKITKDHLCESSSFVTLNTRVRSRSNDLRRKKRRARDPQRARSTWKIK